MRYCQTPITTIVLQPPVKSMAYNPLEPQQIKAETSRGITLQLMDRTAIAVALIIVIALIITTLCI
jgi:hypothetical protein